MFVPSAIKFLPGVYPVLAFFLPAGEIERLITSVIDKVTQSIFKVNIIVTFLRHLFLEWVWKVDVTGFAVQNPKNNSCGLPTVFCFVAGGLQCSTTVCVTL